MEYHIYSASPEIHVGKSYYTATREWVAGPFGTKEEAEVSQAFGWFRFPIVEEGPRLDPDIKRVLVP